MFRQTFYFSLIRKYVTLFGTLFDDVAISRTDGSGTIKQFIKVPITYAQKDKMLARVLQDPNIQKQSAMITMPVMSFEMTGLSYDSNRKLPTVKRVAVTDPTNANNFKYQYSPVPYNFNFRLYIAVKNVEDGTKIVEQILPFFTPDWTTTVHLIPEMDITMDIPVILNSISHEDTFDGSFSERQHMTWTLDFTLRGYLYGPVKSGAIIKFANTSIYAPDAAIPSSIGNVTPATTTIIQPGLTANGQPTSNAANTIDPNLITATTNFGFITTTTDLTT
jgi:hypothetical protein